MNIGKYSYLLTEAVKPNEHDKNISIEIFNMILNLIKNENYSYEDEFLIRYKNTEITVLVVVDEDEKLIQGFASDNIIQIILSEKVYSSFINNKNIYNNELLSTIRHELFHINQNIENRQHNFKDRVNFYGKDIGKYINSSIEAEVIMKNLIHELIDNYNTLDKKRSTLSQIDLYNKVVAMSKTSEMKLFMKYASEDKKDKLKRAFFRLLKTE